MKTKIVAFALSLSMLIPTVSNAKPSASARASGSSISSARSSSFSFRAAPRAALSPRVSSFEKNASRRAGAADVSRMATRQSVPNIPQSAPPAYPQTRTARTVPQGQYYSPSQPSVVHHYYHDDSSSTASALTGLAAGMALGALASHHDDAVAAPRAVAPPEPQVIQPEQDYSDYSSDTVSHQHSGSGFITFLVWFTFIVAIVVAAGTVYYFFVRVRNSEPSDSISPPSKKNDIVEGFPNMIPGSIMTVEDSYFQNDPSSSNPQLHAELDKSGTVTIVGVSQNGDNVKLYADRNGDEFANLSVSDGEVTDARYFSTVFEYPILGQSDWLTWVGPNGMIGNQWFQTGDATSFVVKWKRAIFSDTEDRIQPDTYTETVHMNGKQVEFQVTEMTYFRNTGFASPFASREYLMIRAYRSVDSSGAATCYVRTFAGVDISPASLQLV